jgi:multidrug efflux pump subunit AcrA (membrane-fusion protein)
VYAKEGANGNGLMVVIEDTEDLKIITKFKEYDSGKINEGMEVIIKSDATGEETYEGKITKIAPTSVKNNVGESLSTTDVEFEAEVSVISQQTKLKIGMNTRLNVILNRKTDVFSVPYDAVVKNDKDENVIYVLQEKENGYIAVQKPVEVGMETDFYQEIVGDNLTEGMKIISDAVQITDQEIVMID